jgi:hypothetical protein
MKKKIFAAGGLTTLALLTAGLATAQSGPARFGRGADINRAQLVSQLEARFASLDANGDGNLSAADRERSVEASFKQLDADGNGAITLAELKAGSAKNGDALAGGSGRGGASHGRRGGSSGSSGSPQKADSNGDGIVSKSEFQAVALAGFDKADADRNGVLTAAERRQAHAAARRPKAS